MGGDDITLLLVLEARDKATQILDSITKRVKGYEDATKAASAQANRSAAEVDAANTRAAASSAAFDRATKSSADAQAGLKDAMLASKAAQLEAAAAAREGSASVAAAERLVTDAADQEEIALVRLQKAEQLAAARAGELAEAQRAAAGETEKSSGAMKGVGIAAGAVAIGVGVIGYASIKAAGDYQSSTNRLVTSAGESRDNIELVRQGMLKMAGDVGYSTDALSKAMYTVESGGQHGADGLKVLRAAAEGAKTENADLGTVADATTSILKDYHLTADDAASVTSKLVAATSQGKTTFQDLSGAMSAVMPVASAAHVPLNDVLGDLAAMTVHGESAQQAAQNLADTIRHMQNPTATQAKELSLLGMNTSQLASDLQSKGLSGTLQEISTRIKNMMPPGSQQVILQLGTALKSLPAPVQELGQKLLDGSISMKEYGKAAAALDPISAKQAGQFATLAGQTHRIGDAQVAGKDVAQSYAQALAKATGDSSGLNTALMLTGENADTANGAVKAVGGAATEAGNHVSGWASIQDTFNQKMDRAKDALGAAKIAIGTGLLPAVTTLAGWVTKIVTPIAEWIEKHQKLSGIILASLGGIATFLVVVAAAVKIFGLVKIAIEGVSVALKFLGANPYLIAIMAIAIIAILIITHWSTVKKWLAEFWDWLVRAAKSAAQFFVKIWDDVVSFFKRFWPAILIILTGGFGLIVVLIIKYRKDIGEAFAAIWRFLVDIWNDTGGKLVSAIAEGWRKASAAVLKEWGIISAKLSAIWSELTQIWDATGGKLFHLIAELATWLGDWLSKKWQDAVTNVTGWWRVLSALAEEIWGFISASIRVVVRIITDFLSAAWALISGEVKIAWDLIWALIKAAWDIIFGVIRAALDIVWGVIKSAWDVIVGVFKIAWDLIKGIINTALDLIKGILRIFLDLVTGQWGRMWSDIVATAKAIGGDLLNLLRGIWNDIYSTLAGIAHNLWSALTGVWHDITGGIMGAAHSMWDGLRSAFQTGVDAVSKAWQGLADAAKAPVRFVVNTVINGGVIDAYNWIAGKFGVGKIDHVNLPAGFAAGGRIPGAPSDADNMLAMVATGEHIMPTQRTSRWLPVLESIRLHDRLPLYPGDLSGLGVRGYAGGGVVGALEGAAGGLWDLFTDPAKLVKGPLNAIINSIPGAGVIRDMVAGSSHKLLDGLIHWITGAGGSGSVGGAMAFLKAQVGKPYIWASAGPDGYDCSGIVSAVFNVLKGHNPYSHTFSTSNEAPFFPLGGPGGLLTAGWTNPGEPGPGGSSVGHTAGVLAGMPFESTGPGVRMGSAVTPVSAFAHVGHFDQGGPIYPGWNAVYNGTRGMEHIADPRGGAAGSTVVFDLRGSQIMSDRDIDLLIDKLDKRLARVMAPGAGIQVRR